MSDLLQLSVAEAIEKLRTKEISSLELTKAYLKQIDEVDDSIGAYLYVDEQGALEMAKSIDAKRQRGEDLPPLAGIPIAIKDNICTVDMPTTCASKILEGYSSPFDATVVKKLKAQGAIILGKLNLDEFAMGSTTENSYFKKTKNPVNTAYVPGGSSGGSAAAVASKQAMLTLGSDTGGSIRQPASFCGVTGLKPTYGSVSRKGLIAFASSLDQIGPLGRTAEDIAIMLDAIAGHDEGDSTSADVEHPSYHQQLNGDMKGVKIGIPSSFFGQGLSQSVKEAVLQAAEDYKRMGATIESVEMTNIAPSLPAYYIISSAEASSNLARFDGVQYGYRAESFETLEELYKKSRSQGFGKEVKRRILLGTYALSSGYYDAYYKKALKMRTLIKNEFDHLFKTYDLILTPVAPTPAYKFGEKSSDPLEMYMGDIYTVPVNISGCPAISVNCGYDDKGLPIGMQLISAPFTELKLLNAAHAYEQYGQGGK